MRKIRFMPRALTAFNALSIAQQDDLETLLYKERSNAPAAPDVIQLRRLPWGQWMAFVADDKFLVVLVLS
jgi:hypothetical protein